MENNQTENGCSEMAVSLEAGLRGEEIIFPVRAKEDNKSPCCDIQRHRHVWSWALWTSALTCDAGENHGVARRKVDTLDLTYNFQHLSLQIAVLI